MTHFHPVYVLGDQLEVRDEAHDTARKAWADVRRAMRDNYDQDRAGGLRLPTHVWSAYARAAHLTIVLDEAGTVHVPGVKPGDTGMTYAVAVCTESHETRARDVR